MDISSLEEPSLKIRFKHATFVVDPPHRGSKISSDAILQLYSRLTDSGRVADYRIVINGPGEYEINGVKILGVRIEGGLIYNIVGDGMRMVLGKTNEVSKLSATGGSALRSEHSGSKTSGRKEELDTECQIAVLNVDGEFSQSIVTTLEPKVIILWGNKKEEGAKILGRENLPPVKKFTMTKDKLPEEMEVVLLS